MKASMRRHRDFSAKRIIFPVSKFGIQMPLLISPIGSREFYLTHSSERSQHSRNAPLPEEMKHNFAIRALKKPGFFARRPYIYLCIRCRQIFLVNEHRGSIVAIDHYRNPLPEPENSKQVATFAEGPCPSFKFALKAPRRPQPATTIKSSMLKPRLLRIVASFCPEFRGHQSIATASKKAQAMLAITPQEFLF
jgi:hypothetical protein